MTCPYCEKSVKATTHNKKFCDVICRNAYFNLVRERKELFRLNDYNYNVYCRIHKIKNKRGKNK